MTDLSEMHGKSQKCFVFYSLVLTRCVKNALSWILEFVEDSSMKRSAKAQVGNEADKSFRPERYKDRYANS